MTPARQRKLAAVAVEATGCRNCELWRYGTQTVFGEGPPDASLMLVGEQPGDQEDRKGRPFVGPAGRVLDEALERVGIDRSKTYLTNAVKHFKWEPRGKRRLHKRPATEEVRARHPWLEAEIDLVRPTVLVAMGAVAAQSMFGSTFRVMKERGRFLDSPLAPRILATVHPSSVLRAGEDERRAAMDGLVADLSIVAAELRRLHKLGA